MAQLQIRLDHFIRLPGHLLQLGQRHDGTGETGVFSGGHIPFRIPERVEHADERGALAGEIVEVEQLETAETGSAQGGLDLVFVAERLKFSGGHQEILRLGQKAVALRRLLEDFKVLRLEESGVFRDLVEIRIDAPLADLVGNDRHLRVGLHKIGPVEIRAWRLGVDDRIHSQAQARDARFHRVVEIAARHQRPTGGGGPEAARILRLPARDVVLQPLRIVRAGGFVAVGHHQKRRMIAIFAGHARGFLVDPCIEGHAAAEFRAKRSPGGGFDLEIKARFVGSDEGCLGRTPRVETHVVQSMHLANSGDTPP